MKDRAIRRKQQAKFKNRARKIAKEIIGDENPEKIEDFANHIVDNRAVCSCQMCRNPRHSSFNRGDAKLTKQEKIAKIKEKNQLDEDLFS
jgi:hypothetical protein